jgi:hypothetical protein
VRSPAEPVAQLDLGRIFVSRGISQTNIGDEGFKHLVGLRALEQLIVTDTKISTEALAAFRRDHPGVQVHSEPPPKGAINRFTGKPS